MNVEGLADLRQAGKHNFRFDTSKCHIFDIDTEENISLKSIL